KHPEMIELKMRIDDKLALLFFLMCLTDDDVLNERAQFAHPSLKIVNGYRSALPTPIENIQTVEHSP
ncbi:MAG: hypothetical protein ABI557_21275, partial [Aureliella sp.]